MFSSFKQSSFKVNNAIINYRIGGKGPPLLLLHGYPQCHVHWHAVAPLLKSEFTLIIPDLRGYGDSIGPEPDPEHQHYSKRTMAKDMVALMTELGHEHFFLAGHDRGARVAYRLTLDYQDKVKRLASIDTIPTAEVWAAMDMNAALDAFHWPFLAQPAPLPEKLIGADPDYFLMYLLNRWMGKNNTLADAAVCEYQRHFRKPSVLQAMAEDYRAGATIDLVHDKQDIEQGKKITCPVFVPYAKQYTGTSLLKIWEKWALDVTELCVDCGHFIAEEEPEICAQALKRFFLDKKAGISPAFQNYTRGRRNNSV